MAEILFGDEQKCSAEPPIRNDSQTASIETARLIDLQQTPEPPAIIEQQSESTNEIVPEQEKPAESSIGQEGNENEKNRILSADGQLEQQSESDKSRDSPFTNKTTQVLVLDCPAPVSKKKDDDKLTIYKALAIKLKKELVKTREELQKLREEYQNVSNDLKSKLKDAEGTLETERIISANTNATLEATIKSLREQLESSENDLQAMQAEFENYKTRASQIMQQNNPMQSALHSNRSFEEERYKHLKRLNDDYKTRIADISAQLGDVSRKNCDLEREVKMLREKYGQIQLEADSQKSLEVRCERLVRENENLRAALEYHSAKQHSTSIQKQTESSDHKIKTNDLDTEPQIALKNNENSVAQTALMVEMDEEPKNLDQIDEDTRSDTQVSPSGSSSDSYVHIKPAALEIVSRSSVLEEAQNQIDNLTKAYLDSESTNSLLSEQVRALKEEIRRIQRGTERLELANNLEYLKNIVFRFLSLDSGQTEQKQRLVPVLSTVLKLSREETAKLESIAATNRASVTNSLFKLG